MRIRCWNQLVNGVEQLHNGTERHYYQNINDEKVYKVPKLIGLMLIPYLRVMWDYIEVEVK